MAYTIGIDIGTGSVKAVAVADDLHILVSYAVHYGSNAPQDGYHEQDPEEIWIAFTTVLNQTIANLGQPATIALSSAMHSVIPIDQFGLPLAPMVTWADNRSATIATALRNTETGIGIYETTGTPLHAMSPLCKLIWLKEHNPQLFHKTYKFISIKEFIWYKLFKNFIIDHSIASATGLFDIEKLIWHPAALELAGIQEQHLSNPVPTYYTDLFSGNSLIPNLEQNTPFLIGASDGCLANAGCCALENGVAVVTIGTSGAVRILKDKPSPNTAAMTFSYILEQGKYICGGPVNNGGLALDWWIKIIDNQSVYDKIFEQIVQIPAGSDNLLFLPYLTGERAPIWDSESSGAFLGIKLKHTQAHFSKAVVEGICYTIKDVLTELEVHSPINKLYISGGIIKSDHWMQILSDITGKTLEVVQSEDASALGAVYLAMKTAGTINDFPVHQQPLKTITPDQTNHELYTQHFQLFKKAYVNLKNTMHQLNQIHN